MGRAEVLQGVRQDAFCCRKGRPRCRGCRSERPGGGRDPLRDEGPEKLRDRRIGSCRAGARVAEEILRIARTVRGALYGLHGEAFSQAATKAVQAELHGDPAVAAGGRARTAGTQALDASQEAAAPAASRDDAASKIHRLRPAAGRCSAIRRSTTRPSQSVRAFSSRRRPRTRAFGAAIAAVNRWLAETYLAGAQRRFRGRPRRDRQRPSSPTAAAGCKTSRRNAGQQRQHPQIARSHSAAPAEPAAARIFVRATARVH
jgi:hypothetical protein